MKHALARIVAWVVLALVLCYASQNPVHASNAIQGTVSGATSVMETVFGKD